MSFIFSWSTLALEDCLGLMKYPSHLTGQMPHLGPCLKSLWRSSQTQTTQLWAHWKGWTVTMGPKDWGRWQWIVTMVGRSPSSSAMRQGTTMAPVWRMGRSQRSSFTPKAVIRHSLCDSPSFKLHCAADSLLQLLVFSSVDEVVIFLLECCEYWHPSKVSWLKLYNSEWVKTVGINLKCMEI